MVKTKQVGSSGAFIGQDRAHNQHQKLEERSARVTASCDRSLPVLVTFRFCENCSFFRSTSDLAEGLLGGGKFMKLDLCHAHSQVKLVEASPKWTKGFMEDMANSDNSYLQKTILNYLTKAQSHVKLNNYEWSRGRAGACCYSVVSTDQPARPGSSVPLVHDKHMVFMVGQAPDATV
ncbi:hypothetical protein RRG08_000049 [Elysia crispata]|uniref:Uncharacterized protein n=1 Tax=Elysia crispata TaxID=231223 RepID=A0AAE0Y638_9GAST|nr:hypothetical protein RRG08_000049 [Elysia crispata]